jgi:ABC-type phosphate transport system auxiliary subunit
VGQFYEKLGDALANELVEWFNQVDAAYRYDLRELNELNFARFDAKLEQRLAQFEAKLEQRLAQFEARVEQRFAQRDAMLERRVAELRAEMQIGLHSLETKLIRWMFLFWIGQAATTVGMVYGLLKLTAR